jgi:hypothetical protein
MSTLDAILLLILMAVLIIALVPNRFFTKDFKSLNEKIDDNKKTMERFHAGLFGLSEHMALMKKDFETLKGTDAIKTLSEEVNSSLFDTFKQIGLLRTKMDTNKSELLLAIESLEKKYKTMYDEIGAILTTIENFDTRTDYKL